MRTLPLLLVISTTLFHLAFANLCGPAIYGGAGQNFGTGSVVNVNSTFTGGTITMGGDCAVFSSSCKAEKIRVTGGFRAEIYPNRTIRIRYSKAAPWLISSGCDVHNGNIREIGRGEPNHQCNALPIKLINSDDPDAKVSLGCNNDGSNVVTGRGQSRTRLCPIEVYGKRSSVTIEYPTGTITTSGMGLRVRAICTARPSTLHCAEGYCEWEDVESEDEAPVETGEATGSTPATVTDSAFSSHSGNVFGSPCNADQIHVTNDAGGYALIGLHGTLVEDSKGMSVTAGGCVPSDFVIGPGKSLSECPIRYVDKEKGGVLRIFVKNGIITSSGAGIKATARCSRTQSPVVCKEGKCEGPGVSGGDGSSGEEVSVTPGKPNPADFKRINGTDDKFDSGSDQTIVKDSINGISKQIESATEAEEKTSTTMIVMFVVGGIVVLAGFGAFLVCTLKNRSSNVDEADVEEGDADSKTDVMSEVTSEQ